MIDPNLKVNKCPLQIIKINFNNKKKFNIL